MDLIQKQQNLNIGGINNQYIEHRVGPNTGHVHSRQRILPADQNEHFLRKQYKNDKFDNSLKMLDEMETHFGGLQNQKSM